MTLQTMQKMIEDTQQCKEITKVNEDWYYVPTPEGRICYKVMVTPDGREYCTCEEFGKNPSLKCPHIYAVINAIRTGDFIDIDNLPMNKLGEITSIINEAMNG